MYAGFTALADKILEGNRTGNQTETQLPVPDVASAPNRPSGVHEGGRKEPNHVVQGTIRGAADPSAGTAGGNGGGTAQAAGQSVITTIPPAINMGSRQTVKFTKRIPIQFEVTSKDNWKGIAYPALRSKFYSQMSINDWVKSNSFNVIPIESSAFYMNFGEQEWVKRTPMYRYKSAKVKLSNFNIHTAVLSNGNTQWMQNTSGIACYSLQTSSRNFSPWTTAQYTTDNFADHFSLMTYMATETGNYRIWPYKLGVMGARMPIYSESLKKIVYQDEGILVPDVNRLSTVQMDTPFHSEMNVQIPEGQWRSYTRSHLRNNMRLNMNLNDQYNYAKGPITGVNPSSQSTGTYVGQPLTKWRNIDYQPSSYGITDTTGAGTFELIRMRGQVTQTQLPGDFDWGSSFQGTNNDTIQSPDTTTPSYLHMYGSGYMQKNVPTDADLWTLKFQIPIKEGTEDQEPSVFVNCFIETEIEVEINHCLNDLEYLGGFIYNADDNNPAAEGTFGLLPTYSFEKGFTYTASIGMPSIAANHVAPITWNDQNIMAGSQYLMGNNTHGQNCNPIQRILASKTVNTAFSGRMEEDEGDDYPTELPMHEVTIGGKIGSIVTDGTSVE